ncbi:hypothetical protein ACFX15_027615 [Malus domestica]
MEGSVAEDLGAPESWEVTGLDEAMKRLMLSSNKDSKPPQTLNDVPPLVSSSSDASDKFSEDAVNQVDQFLREALQNPRERLSSKLCVHPQAHVHVFVSQENSRRN